MHDSLREAPHILPLRHDRPARRVRRALDAERGKEPREREPERLVRHEAAGALAPPEAERDVRRIGHARVERGAPVGRRVQEALRGEFVWGGVDGGVLEDRPVVC